MFLSEISYYICRTDLSFGKRNEFMLYFTYRGDLEKCRKILHIEDCAKLDGMCEDDNPFLIKYYY